MKYPFAPFFSATRFYLGFAAVLLSLSLWGQEHNHTNQTPPLNNASLGQKAECLEQLQETRQHFLDHPWDKHRPARLGQSVSCVQSDEEFELALGLSDSLIEQARSQPERADILHIKSQLYMRRDNPADGLALRTTLQLLRNALEGDESPEAQDRYFLAGFDLVVRESQGLHPTMGHNQQVDDMFEGLLGEANNDEDQAQVLRLWSEVYARSRFFPDPANRALELLDMAIPLVTYDKKPQMLFQRALLRFGQDQFDGALADTSLALQHERPGTPLREAIEDLHSRLVNPILELSADLYGQHLVIQITHRNQGAPVIQVVDSRKKVFIEKILDPSGPRNLTERLLWVLTPVQTKRTFTARLVDGDEILWQKEFVPSKNP